MHIDPDMDTPSAQQVLLDSLLYSVSHDLRSWTPTPLVLEADPRWYAVPEDGEVHWRDPFVIRDAVGTWHLYLTAKTPGEPGEHGNGVVGHATSQDLVDWEVQPPLGRARGVFDQLEVISLTQIDRTWVLVFSCLGPEIVGAESCDGGVWSLVVDGPGAPVDLGSAARVTSEALYVGRVVETDDGPALLAFRHTDADGAFIGGVTDPIPVRLRADGAGIEIDPAADVPDRWRPSGTASDVTG